MKPELSAPLDTQSHDVAFATQRRQEHAVGITAFVTSELPGFRCIVKQRYTDFLVNEILPTGEVVHLEDVGGGANTRSKKRQREQETDAEQLPVPISEAKAQESVDRDQHGDVATVDGVAMLSKRQRIEDPSVAENAENLEVYMAVTSQTEDNPGTVSALQHEEPILTILPEADKTTLQSVFGGTVTGKILNLHASVVLHPDRKPRDHPTVRSEPISEKASRTEAHVTVRRIFVSKLETATLPDEPGVISIKAAPVKGPSGARGQPNASDTNGAYQKGKLGWTELGGEYLHFTLYKENKDTMEVLFYMASQIKVPIKNFQFAGTKDRRGVTVQRVAIFRVHAERIAKLNRQARGWRVGGFEYRKHGLDLGELSGNEFMLTLRDCHFEGSDDSKHHERLELAKTSITKTAESFKQNGFLNYYGLQRFGTFSTGTHIIGQKMLKGDLEGAIDSILSYPEDVLPENQDADGLKKVPQDDISRADAIRKWRAGADSHKVTMEMPRRFQAESAVMQYLGKKERKTGKLVQDRDWQGALMQIQRNLRLMYVHAYQSFVWNTVIGKRIELYGDKVVEGDLVIVGEKDDAGATTRDEVDEDGEPIFHPAADDSAPSAEDAFTRARHLSEEEAESGRYNIFDIVLPLPGFDVEYPTNAIGKVYEDFMASEAGGGMDPHNMRRAWKDISLSGSYRKMMAKPGKAFSFEVRSYDLDEEQMVETDLERIQKRESASADDHDHMKAGADEESELIPASKDSKIAVVLKLALGSSQYATMALRELTKGGAVNFKPDFSAR